MLVFAITGWAFATFLAVLNLIRIFNILCGKTQGKPKLCQHFKGGVYEFEGCARNAENAKEELVIYKHCKSGQRWVRRSSEFFDEVDRPEYKGPRFRKL